MSSSFFQNANLTAQNQLVTWLNEAGMSEGHKKADFLRKITEILLHQASQMIPTYLDNILSFATDKSSEVKKQLISFIEDLSKNQPQYLPRVVSQLRALLTDSIIAIQKRVIQASSIIYRNALIWICKGKGTVAEIKVVWQQLTELKLHVLNMIDSDNEGIRTHSIKFLEEVVLLQTYDENNDDNGFSLDDIPDSLHFIDRNALEQESEHIFTLLIKFHNSQHISSVNLMACMTTLCTLARFRSKYMPRVVKALGDLHTTLPPTLSQSQVNSVRKHLKMLLLNLIKHPSSNEMYPHLTQLLLDIGMTSQEIVKAIPKERRNKRLGEIKNGTGPIKRIRLDSPQSNSQGSDNSNSRTDFNSQDDSNLAPKFVMNDEIVFDCLNNLNNVVSLVLTTLEHNLPNEMPSHFPEVYKPISNAGTVPQKRNLAKMLISLIKGEPIVPLPSAPEPITKIPLLIDDDEKITLKNAVAKLQATSKADKQIEGAVSRLMEETRQEHLKEMKEQSKEKEKLIPPQTPSIPKLKQKVRLLKLQELTRPIPKEIKEKLRIQALARILNAERDAEIGGASQIRAKLITTFASSYTPELRELVLNYILDDPVNRIDLALNWLYEEYAYMQSFNRHPVTLQPKMIEKHDHNYNNLFCSLVTQICERGDPTTENGRDILLRKLYSEVPLITDEGVDYLKHLVTEEKITFVALEILEEICLMRPPWAHKYITGLLSYAISDNAEIRELVLKSVINLYKKITDAAKKVVEKYAKLYLGFIALGTPPRDLFSSETASAALKQIWTDDLYKVCLNLIMMLFTENEDLLIEVARVYGQCTAEAKRCVLRCMEAPAREMASRNPEAFMRLLDECPRGAETLLTRLVHILTDKTPPSVELVSRVRDLYATRVSDVRFLIPVLNGLTKKEVLAALPKLIKLNPVVVKEVFNKLLGLQNSNDENLPVSPTELLVALHLIDPKKADLKYIIKATALCFAEKQTYTQEVLSLVLQRLMDEPETPVLMMRTLLQALTLYPALSGLTLNILRRLIDKEIWNHKVAWEGWIKCCERTLPASCAVLMALPAAPLAAALSGAPALAGALRAHVHALTPGQRGLLPPHVLAQLAAPVAHGPPPALVPAPVDYQCRVTVQGSYKSTRGDGRKKYQPFQCNKKQFVKRRLIICLDDMFL